MEGLKLVVGLGWLTVALVVLPVFMTILIVDGDYILAVLAKPVFFGAAEIDFIRRLTEHVQQVSIVPLVALSLLFFAVLLALKLLAFVL